MFVYTRKSAACRKSQSQESKLLFADLLCTFYIFCIFNRQNIQIQIILRVCFVLLHTDKHNMQLLYYFYVYRPIDFAECVFYNKIILSVLKADGV